MFLTPFFSFPMTAVHSNKKRDVTAFKSNEAYNIVEQCQMVGGGGGGGVGEGGGGGGRMGASSASPQLLSTAGGGGGGADEGLYEELPEGE